MPNSPPSVAVGSVSFHRLTALFEYVNELIVAYSLVIPSDGPPVDMTSTMVYLASLLRPLVQDFKEDEDRPQSDQELRRQDDERLRTQIFEVMGHRGATLREVASGVTRERVGTATSAGEIMGVSSSGSFPAPGEAVGLTRSGVRCTVDSHRAEVGSRGFRSLKQSVRQFSGKSAEDFHYGKSSSRC